METSVKYLLIGGGLASANAAGKIREGDPDGSILLIGAEPHLPYDRPPYSKNFLTDEEMKPEDTYSKPEEFYPENKIEVRTGTRATKIDRESRTVSLDNGDAVRYEKLLLATGARPKSIGLPGEDLKGVFLLREAEDGIRIREALKSCKKAVMIGAGFIGMEVAAGCATKEVKTTVITHDDKIWPQLRLSPEFNAFIQSYYEEHGVTFLFDKAVEGFEGDGSLQAVRLRGGETVEADFCVVAVGVALNTELAKEAGLDVSDRGEVIVDEYLQTSDPNIYAAGDIARFKDIALEKEWHVEHYMNAMWQGEAVGAIMAGDRKPFDQVAYFFSDEFDLSMIMRGDASAGKSAKVVGDMGKAEFVELYADETGHLRMGIAFHHDYDKLEPIADTLETLIRDRKSVGDIKDDAFEL